MRLDDVIFGNKQFMNETGGGWKINVGGGRKNIERKKTINDLRETIHGERVT